MHPKIVQSDSNFYLLRFYLFFPYFPFFGMCVDLHNLIWDHCSKTISPNVSMFSSIEIFIINSTKFKSMRTNHSAPIDMWRVKQVFVLEMIAWVLWNLIILEAYLHPNGTVVSKDSSSFAEFIKILISWLSIDTFREDKSASHVCFTIFFQPIGHESFGSQSFHSIILNWNVNIQKRCQHLINLYFPVSMRLWHLGQYDHLFRMHLNDEMKWILWLGLFSIMDVVFHPSLKWCELLNRILNAISSLLTSPVSDFCIIIH